MAVTPRFCTRCGGSLEPRDLHDGRRLVCTGCEAITYQNPLPVASAVVLDHERRVLLVKRKNEPKKDMWCPPIGFAELDETIAEAAIRELEEEAGIVGRVARLLDASSTWTEPYGDLLVVTFEVDKIGGREQAGDDAAEARYFALDDLPPLAFEPNQRAIEACRALHADEWEIHDSFARLGEPDGTPLVSDVLVTKIAANRDEIVGRWVADVARNPTTVAYHHLDEDELTRRGRGVLDQFVRLFGDPSAFGQTRAFYRSLGATRRAQGVPLHELLSSISILRKHLWTFALEAGVWSRPIELYRALEMDHRYVLFFDKATYHLVKGYEEGEAADVSG